MKRLLSVVVVAATLIVARHTYSLDDVPVARPAPPIKRAIRFGELTPYRFADGHRGWCFTLGMGNAHPRRFAVQLNVPNNLKDRLKITTWGLRDLNDDLWHVGRTYNITRVDNTWGCSPDKVDLTVQIHDAGEWAVVLLLEDSWEPDSYKTDTPKAEQQQNREQELIKKLLEKRDADADEERDPGKKD